MKKLAMPLLLVFVAHFAVAAQTDICWRDSYPHIPGEWAGSGVVVEAGNRFQTLAGATVELWSTNQNYNDARQIALQHRVLPAQFVERTTSDESGRFAFTRLQPAKQIQPGAFEIRVRMAGRESSSAYTEIGTGFPPQWFGRGIRIALSDEGKGCSRVYAAGLDDTDCGALDCENLPTGPIRIVLAEGGPLRQTRMDFYQHSKKRGDTPDFSIKSDNDGLITVPARRGCFDVNIEIGRSMHLCFRDGTATSPVTVTLPPT